MAKSVVRRKQGLAVKPQRALCPNREEAESPVEMMPAVLGIDEGIVRASARGVIFSTSANLWRSSAHC